MTTTERRPIPSDWVTLSRSRGVNQSLAARVRVMWPLLRMWTGRELRARYRQSILSVGWSLVQPVVLLITYGFVLTSVLEIRQEDLPYLSFAWSGLIVFNFMQQASSQGVGSIEDAGPIISRVYFPREVLPLSFVLTAAVDLLIATAVLIIVVAIQMHTVPLQLVALPLVYAVLIALAAAFTTIAATASAYRRDVRHAMPLLLRALFIVSPVMYPVALINKFAPALATLNPMTVLIEATRDIALRGRWPNWGLLAAHGAAAALLCAVALLVVRRSDRTISDVA